MCGRITQKSPPNQLGLGLVTLIEPLHAPPRYNGAPGQEHWVIRENPATGDRSLDRLFWGLIPHWVKEPQGGRKPINARAETVASLPSFREAWTRRRCLVPVDSFFEWRRQGDAGGKKPFVIAMASEKPFALGGVWEAWKPPGSSDWLRSFAIVTTTANDLVATIHDRMPVIVAPEDYLRWLDPGEPDPRDLLKPFPAGPIRIWPISTRVNRPANDDASLLDPIDVPLPR